MKYKNYKDMDYGVGTSSANFKNQFNLSNYDFSLLNLVVRSTTTSSNYNKMLIDLKDKLAFKIKFDSKNKVASSLNKVFKQLLSETNDKQLYTKLSVDILHWLNN